MSNHTLVDASLRFAQRAQAGVLAEALPYDVQRQMVGSEVAYTFSQFCPSGYEAELPDVVMYPAPVNDIEPSSILDESIVRGPDGDRLLVTADLISAVADCYDAYFDVSERYSGAFNREEETLKATARILVAAWLFDSLDPRMALPHYRDEPVFQAALQAGILPKGEGDVDSAIDVARYRVIGAAARNGFLDDESYITFQAVYRAMYEDVAEKSRGHLASDKVFGLRFAIMYACGDEAAREMLERMCNIDRVVSEILGKQESSS